MASKKNTTPSPGVISRMLSTHRACPDVPMPNWEPLERSYVFDEADLPIIENIKDHFLREGLLNEKDAISIVNGAAQLFRKEPNLLRLVDPITVCGDIHGQYYDLMKLLEIGGDPKTNKYLFLGDYGDRGCFGAEVVLLLCAIKLRYPNHVYLLRGNHECRHLTAYFNMKSECKYKYTVAVYDAITACFDTLPLACVLDNRFFCCHGGLSPNIKKVEDINNINRFREPPSTGPMCDLLWADPLDEELEQSGVLFAHNEVRGCSYVFSYAAACQFLVANRLLSVIRAHEAQDEGYRLYKKTSAGFPSVICIFSAPNYCDTYDNKAAVIRFQNNLMNIRQYNSNPHPYFLPNFMNAFMWSMPFMAEKVTDMLTTVWQLVDEGPYEEDAGHGQGLEDRKEQIRAKVLAMAKMSRMFRTLREENESIVELKGLAGGQLPLGILQDGPDAIRNAIQGFQKARLLDRPNERRPTYSDN